MSSTWHHYFMMAGNSFSPVAHLFPPCDFAGVTVAGASNDRLGGASLSGLGEDMHSDTTAIIWRLFRRTSSLFVSECAAEIVRMSFWVHSVSIHNLRFISYHFSGWRMKDVSYKITENCERNKTFLLLYTLLLSLVRFFLFSFRSYNCTRS